MSPRTKLRTLLVMGVLAAACMAFHPSSRSAVQSPLYSIEGPLYLDVTCPPSDGYEWHRGKRNAADLTFWIVPVNGAAVIGEASARTYFVGHIALIYSWERWGMASEGKRQHEECHALGWDHGDAPIGGALWR